MSSRALIAVAVLAAALPAVSIAVAIPALATPTQAPGFSNLLTVQDADPSFNVDQWDVQVVTGADGDGAVLWAKGAILHSRLWHSEAETWSVDQPVANDLNDSSHATGSGFTAIASTGAQAAAAWPTSNNAPNRRIEVSLITFGPEAAWSEPITISAVGGAPGDIHLAWGADGTLAATWLDEGGIKTAVRDTDGNWSPPATVSTDIDTNVLPEVDTPSVVVAPDGAVTAAWWAYDPNDSGGMYRLVSRTRDATGGWGDQELVAPDGSGDANSDPRVPANLAAASDGTVVASWGQKYLSERGPDGWAAQPTTISTVNGPTVALAPEADGRMLAVWPSPIESPLPHFDLLTSEYTPADGWGTVGQVQTPGGTVPYDPDVFIDENGTAFVTWRSANPDNTWTLLRSRHLLGEESFESPVQLTAASQVWQYSTGFDAKGYQLVAFNLDDSNPSQRDHGEFTVHAAAMLWPNMQLVDPPHITGVPAVGNTLTASPGVWGPTPTQVEFRWVGPDYPTQGYVSGPQYTLGVKDAGYGLTVEVIVHAPFHNFGHTVAGVDIDPLTTTLTGSAPRKVGYDDPLTVTGKLTTNFGAVLDDQLTATLQTRPVSGGQWVSVRTVHLSTSPFHATLFPRRNFEWRWHFVDDGTLTRAISATHGVTVVPGVSLHVRRSTLPVDARDAVWGIVETQRVGERVAIQRNVGGAWQTIARLTTERQMLPTGRVLPSFLWSFTPHVSGTWTLRAVRWAQEGIGAGVSRTITLFVG